jgi:hypothetical protein
MAESGNLWRWIEPFPWQSRYGEQSEYAEHPRGFRATDHKPTVIGELLWRAAVSHELP